MHRLVAERHASCTVAADADGPFWWLLATADAIADSLITGRALREQLAEVHLQEPDLAQEVHDQGGALLALKPRRAKRF